MSEWHLGEIASSQARIAEAIALARELYSVDRLPGQEMNDTHALALALQLAGIIAWGERDLAAVDRLASELIELSTRHNFSYWLIVGTILRGWARSASGDIGEGIPWIEDGINDYRASGVKLPLSFYLALKAEALYLAGRTSEALEAITEAGALVPTTEERWWCAELYRLRAVFLAATGAEENLIEASFCAAIRTAKEQKSVSLEKRAEASYAEYRRQKASGSRGRGFRLALW
jgi:predicted ATPase